MIDSSISIAWCFPDEQDDYSQTVLDALASERAFVPDLWHLEVANTLLVGERRKRSTQANTVTWLGFLSSLPIAVDEETKAHAFGNTLSLARDHNLSAYDAAYLELAMRRVCRWQPSTTSSRPPPGRLAFPSTECIERNPVSVHHHAVDPAKPTSPENRKPGPTPRSRQDMRRTSTSPPAAGSRSLPRTNDPW